MPLAHTNSVHIAIVGVLAGMIACSDGDHRTVSLAPSPSPAVASAPVDQEKISIRSIMPGSGATLTVQPCPVGSGHTGMWCVADQVSLTFDLEFSQDVVNPVVSASLYPDPNGGQWCAWGEDHSLADPYRAGSRVVVTMTTLNLSRGDGRPICPLPTTTTVMWIHLYGRAGYFLLEQDFPVTYTFVAR